MSLNFNYDDEEVKKKALKTKEKHDNKGGGYTKAVKLESKRTYLLILPSNNEKRPEPYYETFHYNWGQGKGFKEVASAAAIDDKDDMMSYRKKLYDAFGEQVKAQKKPYSDLASALGVKRKFLVNAIKLKKTKSGWKVDEIGHLSLPTVANKLFLSELGDEGVKSVCDPNHGRILVIEGNGESGFNRRYETAKFLSKKALLLKNKVVEEEEILEGMVDLEGEQKAFSAKGIKMILGLIKKHAKFAKLFKKLEALEDDADEEFDEEGDDDMELDNDSGDDDLEDDDEESDDDDLEDDDEESDDDDLEDDDEEGDDLEDDDDGDELEDDDDELEDDLEDDEIEEEEVVDVKALKKEYNTLLKSYKKKKSDKLKKKILAIKKEIKENS